MSRIDISSGLLYFALENSNTRVTIMLDGLETHMYNRSNEYARLEKVFGIDEFMIPKTGKESKSSTGFEIV